MATSNNRDVKMTLSVETLGTDDIKKLRDQVAALAKQGGDAAPEFQRLADEIGRLGDQSDALRAFQALSAETEELTARQRQAAASVEELAAKYQAAAGGTRAAAEAQRAIAEQLDAARAAQRASRDELATLIATTDKAKVGEQAYADEVQRLRLAKIEQRAEVERLTAALKTSNEAVTAAERAEAKLEGTYNRAAQAAGAAEAAVAKQQVALRESAQAATTLGVSTENLAESQASVARGFTELQQRAGTLTQRLEALAAQERELASIRAFQQQADDAKRLFDTASYAELFEQALSRVASAEREVAAAQAALDWQREAEAIVNATEATQRLVRQQEIMVQVQRELANDRAMAKVAEDAEKLARQADQIRLFTQVLDQLEEQERQTAEAAKLAGEQVKNAFGAVGVRSVEQLQAEIAQVRAAMETLRGTAGVTGGALQQAFNAGNAKIKELERDIREVTGQLTVADRAAALFKNSLGQIAAGNVIADGVGYLVNKVKELGREFIVVTVQTERMRKGLQAIYKDTAVAAAQFQFLRDTANASGFSISATSDAFLRFAAATKSANIPVGVTNELFVAVTRAGTTLGLTAEGVTGTLDALGQMASKGVVSMEELRQQLGDRLPGALSVSAKGLGLTDQQLIKLVESGQLATRDFFPALTKGLATLAGDTDTLISSWQRFTNMLNEFTVATGDAGGMDVLRASIKGLAVAVGVILVPLQGFVEFLGLAGKAVGLFAGALATGNFKEAFTSFHEELDKSATRITRFQASIDGVVNGTEKQTTAVNAGTAALGRNSAGTLTALAGQEQLAAGVTASNSTFVQQMVRLAENATATEAAVTASEKLLKAKQDEGKALVLTAQLTGDASTALNAQAAAATGAAVTSQSVVEARTREVTITQQSIAAIDALRNTQGKLDADRQAAYDKQVQHLQVQEAELERARQTTFELGRQQLAAEAAATAYADNSTKLGAYKQAMADSQVVASILTDQVKKQTLALGELKDKLETGKITQVAYDQAKRDLQASTDALNKATGDAAKFENLYRDAVADSVAAVDRKARADAASLSVNEALAKAQQAHYETLARQAKALGDEAQATYYTIEAKLKEIEARKLATQIKNLELSADKAGIEIQIAALKPSDELYEQKKKELEIRLESIKVRQIEAGASVEIIKGIEDEIAALRRLAEAKGGTVNVINGNGNGAPPAPAPPEGPRDSFGQIEKINKSNAPPPASAPAPAPKSPFSFSAGGDLQTRTGIANFLRNAGVTDPADIKRLVAEFSDAKGDIPYTNNPGQKKYANGGTISMALMKAAETVTFGKKSSGATAPMPAPSAAAPAAAAGGSSHSVTIDLGSGRRGTFNMASEGDASGLTGLLSQLGNARGSS